LSDHTEHECAAQEFDERFRLMSRSIELYRREVTPRVRELLAEAPPARAENEGHWRLLADDDPSVCFSPAYLGNQQAYAAPFRGAGPFNHPSNL
jgi:hypothetical protein